MGKASHLIKIPIRWKAVLISFLQMRPSLFMSSVENINLNIENIYCRIIVISALCM
jgi:hypothetical protein